MFECKWVKLVFFKVLIGSAYSVDP